jgi:pimeloyl-ACP methyl ester carboxylesterase
MGRKFLRVLACIVLLALFIADTPALARGDTETDSYGAVTADGIRLAIKRYRPETGAPFRKGAQPIILMPGIICNLNYYDVRTPRGEKYDVGLPRPLAPWARGDRYIKKDPMRYYSLAHYLWLQGYDVWMANYRGEGRGPDTSGGMTGYSLDDLGIYDVPAIVERVYRETGKHPVWCGHSMGSTMAFIYLQGAKYGAGDNPHVVSDPELVTERNNGRGPQAIKAFIDMDGPQSPSMGDLCDNSLVWSLLYRQWYLDLRPLTANFGAVLADPLLSILNLLWQVDISLGLPDLDFVNAFLCFNQDNVDRDVGRFIVKYALDGISTRTLGQYLDSSAHGMLREDYENGEGETVPRDPEPGDGYYYYSDNMGKITVPALVLADDRTDVTGPEDIKRFYDSKTRTGLDVFVRIPKAAHVDMVCGLNSPTTTYPEIGNWLRRLSRQTYPK